MDGHINLLIRNPYSPEYEFRLHVRSNLNIGQLKHELETRYEGRPSVEAQRLIHAGRVLQDNEVVGELLQDNCSSDDVESEAEHVFVLALKKISGESTPLKRPSLTNRVLSSSSSSVPSSPLHYSSTSPFSSTTVTSSVFSPSSTFSFGGSSAAPAPAFSSYGTPVSFSSSAPRSFTFSSSGLANSSPAINSFSTTLSSSTSSSSSSTTLSTSICDASTSSSSSHLPNTTTPITSSLVDSQKDNSAPPWHTPQTQSSYDVALEAYLSQASTYYNWMAQMYTYQYHMHRASQAAQPYVDQSIPVLHGTGLRYRLQPIEAQALSDAPPPIHSMPAQLHIPAPEPVLHPRVVAPAEILPPRVPLSFKVVLKLTLLLAAGFALRSVLLVAFAIAWFVQQTGLLRGLRAQAPVVRTDNNDVANIEVTAFVAVKRFFVGFFCSLMPSWRPTVATPLAAR